MRIDHDIHINDMAAASRYETHAHDHEALLSYAASGSCTQLIGPRLWTVLPAHAVWIPAGTPHAVAAGPRGCRLRTVRFPLPVPDDLPATPCVIEVSPFLAALIAELGEAGSDEHRRREALRFLIHDALARSPLLDLSLPRVSDPRLLRVTDALQADPSDRRSLTAWAQLADMSRRSFIRKFQAETEMGLQEWQRRLRVLMARQMLADGASVTETALSLGYATPSAFIAMIRRELGTTPGQLFAAGPPAP